MDESLFDATGPEIVTEGAGWHEQPGDRAELDLTYTAIARTRTDAVHELNHRVAGANPVLDGPGLRVTRRSLRVHNEWRGNRVVGCRAAEEIALLVTDVTVLEATLSALVATEPTALHGPRWQLTDPAAGLREAQRLAVEDARRRAEGYAVALGGTLGPLRKLSEGLNHALPAGGYRLAAAEAAGPDVRDLGLEPEPVRVTAQCTTTWAFLPTQ
ncbi:SIMPL domain-containing protein [Pseudonocardia nigra]|uniref:SIMPL domain-containing protein n=1 Tax=Pseudonocardia nigra TaxID=1921578 RepID=UPI001C5CF3E6|nr:SIMPL domain-containing protein [Pseudonocardia nigra]